MAFAVLDRPRWVLDNIHIYFVTQYIHLYQILINPPPTFNFTSAPSFNLILLVDYLFSPHFKREREASLGDCYLPLMRWRLIN